MKSNAESNRRFIERRTERRRIGLLVFPLALIAVVVGWGLLFAFYPLAVNPWTVFAGIASHTLAEETLGGYAIVCTILVNIIFALLCAFLVLCIAWARHERRYLRMLAIQAALAPIPVQKSESPQSVS
jgi:ABC-type Fe3+ transport system permease subunit